MNSLAQYRVYNAVNYFSGDERLQLGATLNQFSIFVQLLFTKCRVFARVQIVRVSPYLYVFKNKYLGKGKDNFFSSLKQSTDVRPQASATNALLFICPGGAAF